MVLLCLPWGFNLARIDIPVELWHGELDRNVPIAHGYRLAAALANCFEHFVAGAGHYLIFDYWEAILTGLVVAHQPQKSNSRILK